MSFRRICLLLVIACCGLSANVSLASVPPKLRVLPRVLKYDPVKDEMIYIDSSVSTSSKDLPGGDINFGGNRLNRFRYIGPKNTGGLYDAINDYQLQTNPDPKKFRYRYHQY